MEKERSLNFIINHPIIRTQKKAATSNSFPNNHQVEESLIPSDLLNESSEYESSAIKKSTHHHPKSQSPKKRQALSSSKPPKQNTYHLLFEADIKELIPQLKTHYGSICFQNSLTSLNENEINALLIRICPHLTELMCSHYGNYFIQKLFQKLNYNQRILIFSLIQYTFIQLSTDKIGTYSIQALIDSIKTPSEEKIIQSLLMQNLLLLFCNENGHHIIQKIIIDFPEHKREFLSDFIIDNIDKICMSEYGSLCMVKFIIMNSNLNLRLKMIKALEKHVYKLFSNKNSCAVLLFLMEKYGYPYSGFIISEIKKNIVFFSIQNPLTYSIAEKSIELLNKFDNNDFVLFSWNVIKSDKILKNMAQSESGKKILIVILNHINVEQKNFFRSKKASYFIHDQNTYEIIMNLLN